MDPQSPQSPQRNDDDLLGLDQQIKITKTNKVAKVDQDRLLGKNGLPYIINNYHKVNKTIKKNDKNAKNNRCSKEDAEIENLSSVLQFYQLWCHTLFPKANFQDCIQLIRGVTNRSPQLKMYRRQLIDQELHKQRSAQGIIDVSFNEMPGSEGEGEGELLNQNHDNGNNDDDDDDNDDWMAPRNPGNGLFVDENEDIYGDYQDARSNQDDARTSHEDARSNQEDARSNQEDTRPNHEDTSSKDVPDNTPQAPAQPQNQENDAESDQEFYLMNDTDFHLPSKPQTPHLEEINDAENDEEYEIMNEMGL